MKENKPLASYPCHICNCKHQEQQYSHCVKWKTWFKETWHSIQKQAGIEDEKEKKTMNNDLISREAFYGEIQEYVFPITVNNLMGAADVYYRIVHLLEEAPAVDAVEVVHAKWIMRGGLFRCSKCDAKALWRKMGGTGGFSCEYEQAKTKSCPGCDARMDGE